jgi:GAF domain-containing protein
MTVTATDVHRALKDLGSLRFGQLDVQTAMQQIATTTHALFDVDGAGLLLLGHDDRLRTAASSDDRVARLEQLQIEHDEGPCLDAYTDRELVCSEDLGAEQRWPTFCAAAVEGGLQSVLASPIPYNQDAIGVVVVVSAEARAWSPEGELALVAFTDLAALLIASTLQGQQTWEAAEHLQRALDAKTVIEQAKAVLVSRGAASPHAAYEQLRAQARRERRRIDELAREIVGSSAPA